MQWPLIPGLVGVRAPCVALKMYLLLKTRSWWHVAHYWMSCQGMGNGPLLVFPHSSPLNSSSDLLNQTPQWDISCGNICPSISQSHCARIWRFVFGPSCHLTGSDERWVSVNPGGLCVRRQLRDGNTSPYPIAVPTRTISIGR